MSNEEKLEEKKPVIKNKTNMYCKNCKEIIAKSGVAELIQEKHDFEGFIDFEKTENWWVFKDMFHFENIGFTRLATKKNHRFLCCAACEKEVLGFCVDGVDKFYLSSEKVDYKK
jgi:hypothetical protein